MDTKVKDLITSAFGKIHEMSDASTIMGEPLKLEGGITIIPVSKVSYGFAGGGSDLPSKTDKELFGGGTGAGISITPIGFLVVNKGEVQLMQINQDKSPSAAIVNMVPDVINKVTAMFKKDKDSAENGETDDIELPEEMMVEETSADVTKDIDFDL